MEKTGYIRLTSQVKNEKRNSKCWAAIDAVFTFFGENDKKSVKAKKFVCGGVLPPFWGFPLTVKHVP